jgi:hypothetical protein
MIYNVFTDLPFDFIDSSLTLIIIVINMLLISRDRMYKLIFYYQPSKNGRIYLCILNEGVRNQYLREIVFNFDNKRRTFIQGFISKEYEDTRDTNFHFHIQKNDSLDLPYQIKSGEMIVLSFDTQLNQIGDYTDIHSFYQNSHSISLKINNKYYKLNKKKIIKAKIEVSALYKTV